MKSVSRILFLLLLIVAALGCRRASDPSPETENETITTARVTLTKQGTSTTVVGSWKLLTLGGSPTTVTLALQPNTTYDGTIAFLDETKTPVADITEEVEEEATEHIVFYQPLPTLAANVVVPGTATVTTGDLKLTVNGLNTDGGAPPRALGTSFTATTGAASTGSIRIVLRHQPGEKDGTFAPGSSDVDATIPITIAIAP